MNKAMSLAVVAALVFRVEVISPSIWIFLVSVFSFSPSKPFNNPDKARGLNAQCR